MTPAFPPENPVEPGRLPFGGWDSYQTWERHDFMDRARVDDRAANSSVRSLPRTIKGQGGSPRFRITLNDDMSAPDGMRLACRLIPASRALGVLDEIHEIDEVPEDEDDLELVRPYVRSRKPSRQRLELQLETVISSAKLRANIDYKSVPEQHQRIRGLCRLPQSVAEVAAQLDVPFGETQVLVGDAIEMGLLTVHKPATTSTNGRPTLDVLRRVHEGLRKLA